MNNTHFLNIDLDLESTVEISELVDELSTRLTKMTYHNCEGVFRASFETSESDIENSISTYVSAINELSPGSKKCWSQCIKREFNFGYQSEISPRNYESHISQNAIKEIALLNGQIGITIYAPENNFT